MTGKYRHIVDRPAASNIGRQSQKPYGPLHKPVSLPSFSILSTKMDVEDGWFGHQMDRMARELGLVPDNSEA